MDISNLIGYGKENAVKRKYLLRKSGLSEESFRSLLKEMRNKRIIIVNNDEYYYPNSKEEYLSFMRKLKMQIKQNTNTLELARKEIDKLGE